VTFALDLTSPDHALAVMLLAALPVLVWHAWRVRRDRRVS
jgi:hypothetical protein